MADVFSIERNHEIPTIGLMHFAGGDGSVYVNWVASIMFNDFQLSINGQRNVATCLSNLPYIETPDERLVLGWGPDNIIRQQIVHRHGYEHLALLAAMASVFHEAYTAEVCHAYATIIAGENDMVPHLRQWKSQIRTGCGALTASPFTQLVEDYIRLDPYSVGPGSELIAPRCRVPPKEMAKGLMALSKVTSKKEKQVTLVGGAVIGWFAALSEFFYDLKVAILSRTGEVLLGDPKADDVQAILVYHEDPDLKVMTEHWSTITDKKCSDDPFWSTHTHILPFGGRVQWQTLLPQVFGRAFWVLEHEENKALSDLIGSAARVLEADYESHREIADEEFYKSTANKSSHGIGMIQNLTAWLPELRKGQGRMERQLKRPFQEAADHYDDMIAHLQQRCNCDICTVIDSKKAPQNGYCLPTICETIIALGLAISRMTVASAVYPTREGVQGFYASQATKRKEAKHLNVKTMQERAEHYTIIYGREWKANDARRLQNAIELFSGTRPEVDLPESLVAIAHEGICAYMISLRRSDGSAPRDGEIGYIEVTSGAINVRQKIFTRMSTEPVGPGESREALEWEEVKFRHKKRPLYCK